MTWQQRDDPGPALPFSQGSLPSHAWVTQLLLGAWAGQAVSVFTRLGIADVLASGPRHVEQLAESVGADAQSLYRLLRLLADLGLVSELDGMHFALDTAGNSLRHDVPGSCAGLALLVGSAFHRAAWSELFESVRTGHPAFPRVHGEPIFSYLRDHAEDAAVFNAATFSTAVTDTRETLMSAVAGLHDFGQYRTVVDVGGGHGYMLGTILAAYPDLRGVLFDLPHVVAGAEPVLRELMVADRCARVGGSFFEAVPIGGDAYLLSSIIHDWDDEKAVAILRACRSAMADNSTLLMVEHILSDSPRPDPLVKLLDLEMLVVTEQGRQRTRSQLSGLLEQAGLRLTGITVSPARWPSLAEASPVADTGL
jgi:hypothetical protein